MRNKLLPIAAVLALAATAFSQEPQQERRSDKKKSEVELPVKRAVADRGKSFVEMPLKERIADAAKTRRIEGPVRERLADAVKRAEEQPLKNALRDESGRAEPGKVRWHASFDKAVEAATVSGRPVLLFQLLGNLDEEFC